MRLAWATTAAASLGAVILTAVRPEIVEGLAGGWADTAVLIGGSLLFVASIMIPAFQPLWGGMRRNARVRRDLKERGKVMKATIVRVTDTNITDGVDPWVTMTVRTVGDAEATFHAHVSRVAFPRVGETIHVLYDPDDPTVAIKY